MLITPLTELNLTVETALPPPAIPAWVGPCAFAMGAGMLWAYRRNTRGRGVAATPPTRSEIEALRAVLRLVVRARRQGRPLTSGELVGALPDIARVGAMITGRRLAARPPPALRGSDVAPGPLPVEEALDETLAEQRAGLVGLAQKLGVAGAAFDRVLRHEMCVGDIEAFGVARDRAIDCLVAFCEAHALPAPTALCRAYASATVLPHASLDRAPVSLHTVGHAFMARKILAYQPDRLLEWAVPYHPYESSAMAMCRALALPRERRPKSLVGLVPPAVVKTRAVLRAMLQQLTENAVRQSWGTPGREDALVDRLALTLAPVWGVTPSRAVLVEEYVAAVSRLLMDLAWGAHVPSAHPDRWALAQLLSQAVTKLPDARSALGAWFKNDSRALDELGRGVLQEADQLRDSWLRAWSVGA